jgi:AcrR family transcriptional regulator
VHDDATATALLDAAEEILDLDGIDALTVRRVAEHVGTTTRAVYSTLGSKEALLAALVVRAFDLLGARLTALPTTADPVDDLVTAATHGFRMWALEHPALFKAGFLHQLTVPDATWSRFGTASGRALGQLVDRIRRLEQAGGLGARSVEDATVQFDALCEGLAIIDLRGGTPYPARDSQTIWNDALHALIAGWSHRQEQAAGGRRS